MPAASDRPTRGQGPRSILSEDRKLGEALSNGLEVPLAALRASMEAIDGTLPTDAKGRSVLSGPLDEIQRLGRNVRELMEFACVPQPMPLRCTPSEIALAACRGLSDVDRARVVVARDSASGTIWTDAPLVSRGLNRIIENALETESERVLVIVRRKNGSTRFTVVDAAHDGFDFDWAKSAFNSTKHTHLGLGLAITERDIELLNGSLEIHSSLDHPTCVTLVVPDDSPSAVDLPEELSA